MFASLTLCRFAHITFCLTLSRSLVLPGDVLWHLVPLSSSHTISSTLLGLSLTSCLSGLELLERSLSLSSPDLWLHARLLLKIVETNSHHTSLHLVQLTSALLGGGLGESLLVETTPCLGPYELGWLFALNGQGVGFAGAEEDWLSVAADEELAVSWVDSVFWQSAQFGWMCAI